MAEADDRRVCVGVVGAPHGIRGEVRIKSHTAEPLDITAYGPLTTEDGRTVKIRKARLAKDMVIATLDGVNDRNAVETLKNQRLYIDRDKLPEPDEDEWYYADLIGLDVRDTDGETIGTVLSVQDFGGGELLEVRRPGTPGTVLVPFSRAAVPVVDVSGGFVVIDPPPGLLDEGLSDEVREKDEDAQ
jgi:16S rRNA processing protein RimM